VADLDDRIREGLRSFLVEVCPMPPSIVRCESPGWSMCRIYSRSSSAGVLTVDRDITFEDALTVPESRRNSLCSDGTGGWSPPCGTPR
jgi:hypothetical protein